jgi:DHA2 family multidrug resistance protein-like MFS transporter
MSGAAVPMSEQVVGSEPTTTRRWWALAVLCLSVLLVVVDNTIVNVALPTLSRELKASTSDLQWFVDAYTLLFAGLLLTGGGLGDRWGRKPMLQAGLVLFGLTSLWAASSSSTGELIAARAGMGVSAAVVYPATLALLSSIFTDRGERATAIGIWSAVSGLAVVIGPVSGGALLQHFSWHSVFLVNIPLIAVALAASVRLLPNSRDEHPSRFDAVGALLTILSIGLLVWTVIEAPDHGWLSPRTLGGFAGGAALITMFIWWEGRQASPLLDIAGFRNPRIFAASAAIGAAFFALFGFVFLITQFLQSVRGFNPLQAGLAIVPFALVMAGLSPVAILLMKRIGTKLVVCAGLLLMTAGFVLIATTAVDAPYWGPLVMVMVLIAAGLALGTTPATDAIMGAVSETRFGAGSAINDTTREVGGVLGIAVIGSVMNSVFETRIASHFTGLGLPAGTVSAAKQSVTAALGVSQHLPAGLAGPARYAARHAFMDGLHAGSFAGAMVTAVAACAVLAYLPNRDRRPVLQPGHDPEPSTTGRVSR